MKPIEYEPHPYVPAISLSEAPHVLADLDIAVEEYQKTRKRQTSNKPSEQDTYCLKLLRLRAANPYAPVARIYEALGKIRFQAQVAIREKLESEGLAEFEEVRIGRSNMLLMDITSKGYKALRISEPKGNKGRGKLKHCHFAQWIRLYFEKQGKEAYVEWVIPGTSHPVDVAVKSGSDIEIFEICVTAFDNVVSHIKAFDSGRDIVKRLTFIVGTKTKMNELKKQLKSELMYTLHADKIAFDVIEKYVIKELENHEID